MYPAFFDVFAQEFFLGFLVHRNNQNLCGSLTVKAQFFCRCPRKIDERKGSFATTVIYGDVHLILVGKIDNLDLCSQREALMCCSQFLRRISAS